MATSLAVTTLKQSVYLFPTGHSVYYSQLDTYMRVEKMEQRRKTISIYFLTQLTEFMANQQVSTTSRSPLKGSRAA